MRYFLVCNPGSRQRRGAAVSAEYRRILERRGAEFGFAMTSELDDARRLAREAVERGFDAVVAVGGDGTINRVADGILKSGLAQPPAFGVLYAGTSPDFCKFHGLPTSPEAAADALLSGRVRAVDVCRMRSRLPDGREQVNHFNCSANFGLGSGIAERSNRYRRLTGDFLGTFAATVGTVLSSPPRRYRLVLDGREEVLEDVINITVGKNPFLASGLKLQIDVTPDNGQMYCFAIHGMSRAAFLLALPRLYSGSIVSDGRFRPVMAKQITVEPQDCAVRAEFDGDPAGPCPVEVTVVPKALRLLGAA